MQHFSVLLNLNVHKTVAGYDCFCKYIMHNINVYCECYQDKDFQLKENIAALAIKNGKNIKNISKSIIYLKVFTIVYNIFNFVHLKCVHLK